MPLRLVMMGTGDFAVPTFRALLGSRHAVVALVTQPERTGPGRHRHVENPMKALAESHGVPVLQPERIKAPEAIAAIAELGPDLLVVAAYGQILPARLLAASRLGGINLHGSLLPKYRGAAPVNWTLYHGEMHTGVTVIEMLPQLDAGPILAQREVEIAPDETAGALEARLAELGAPLVAQTVDQLEAGTAQRRPQDPEQVTLAPKLKKSDGEIDWSRRASEVVDHIRAMQPWPSAYTFWFRENDPPQRLLILRARAVPTPTEPAPGTVIVAEADRIEVATGEGALQIERLQAAGKRATTAAEFLRGHALEAGDRFGPEA